MITTFEKRSNDTIFKTIRKVIIKEHVINEDEEAFTKNRKIFIYDRIFNPI